MNSKIWIEIGLNLLLLAWVALEGPDQVPMKYSFKGQPYRWVSKESFVISMLVYLLILNSVMIASAYWIKHAKSLTAINLPNKKYWSLPENMAEARRLLFHLMEIAMLFANGIIAATIGLCFVKPGPAVTAITYLILAVSLGLVVYVYYHFRIRPPRA